jgi:hypothetical protein
LSVEAEVCNRGRILSIPDSGICPCNEWPHLLQAVFDRAYLLRQVAGQDELMWDDATGGVSPAQRIRKAKGGLLCDAAPCGRFVLKMRESAIVGMKRVG